MAKKKNKQAPSQPLAPDKYIRTKARNLPVYECLMCENLFDVGQGFIVVARKHASGNITMGVYWVDVFCLGIRESLFHFNLTPSEYNDRKASIYEGMKCKSIPYEEAHNILYGAIEYAEDCGIEPAKSFALTRYMLEEDTDDIPLLTYDFGKNGRPYLAAENWLEADKYLPTLREHTGGDFGYNVGGEEFDGTDERDERDDDDDDELLNYSLVPSTPYSYQHPEYPKTLSLTHTELQRFFAGSDHFLLSKEEIDAIMGLPLESLIKDLQQIILYEIGLTCGEIADEMWNTGDHLALVHALFFLGELEAEEALDTVLEVMRQNVGFADYHFGDSASRVLPLTLYKVGKNKLPELLAFAKEPGLYAFLKVYVFDALTYVAMLSPERRDEVIAWYREVLNFYLDHVDEELFYDGDLAGMMMNELVDIHAKELLPEIESLYDTGSVDKSVVGAYKVVENLILHPEREVRTKKEVLDIYTRYKVYAHEWV